MSSFRDQLAKRKKAQEEKPPAQPAPSAPLSTTDPAAHAPAALDMTPALRRGAPYTSSLDDDDDAPLPPAVLALRSELHSIADNYLRARRRSGKALLVAARWLSEARAAAQHGEWDDFLLATETTADTAERLLRIYDLAMQRPAFAAAVAAGRLNQSAAERLARASTPTEVIDVVLTAEKPPTVADVDRAIRAAKHGAAQGRRAQSSESRTADLGQIPQFAEFGTTSSNSELLPDTLAAEVEALRARNAQLEHTLAAARSIIEEYQDHIIKAQKYKPTSDRGGAVSPLLAALERVRGVLREGAG